MLLTWGKNTSLTGIVTSKNATHAGKIPKNLEKIRLVQDSEKLILRAFGAV